MYKLPVIVVKLQGSRRQLKLNESTLALPYSTLTVVSRETESWASGLGLYMPDAQTTVRQRSSCDTLRGLQVGFRMGGHATAVELSVSASHWQPASRHGNALLGL